MARCGSSTRQYNLTRSPVRINAIFLPLYDLRCRYIISYGGRRSSKSVSTSQLLERRVLESPIRRVAVMRKVARTIRLSTWPRMLAAIDETVGRAACKINKSDFQIELPNGSQILFIGADDPEKLKSIEGITDFWWEEATEFDEADFNVADAGLSADVDPPCQHWLTFNPIPVIPGFQHWIQQRFLGIEHELGKIAQRGEIAVLRSYYRHNKFCPPAVAKVLEGYRESNPQLYKMWGLGEFARLEGVILDNWDIVKAVPEGIPLIGYGLDFGFAEDPAAVIKTWRHNDDLYLQQVVYSTGLTNQQLSAVMVAEGMDKVSSDIVADSAEPKSIRELQDDGWRLVRPAEKGADYKRAAAQYLRGLKIHLLEGSTDLVKEFATWSWKRDNRGKVLPIPADGNDHGIDATIYRVYIRIVEWGVLR